jgi:hypothetical protein
VKILLVTVCSAGWGAELKCDEWTKAVDGPSGTRQVYFTYKPKDRFLK